MYQSLIVHDETWLARGMQFGLSKNSRQKNLYKFHNSKARRLLPNYGKFVVKSTTKHQLKILLKLI